MVIAAASAAALVLPPVRLATRRFRCSPPRLMPEGPEVAVHAETLDGAFAGAPLHAATLLSGRYAATPPENWDALQAALPATVRRAPLQRLGANLGAPLCPLGRRLDSSLPPGPPPPLQGAERRASAAPRL